MTGLLLTGGEGPALGRVEPYLGGVDVIVAADSGVDLAADLGLRPDLIVGDMDSLRDPRALEPYGDRVIRFPTDKDETDTEIGLRLLRERGADRVILAGGGGGRLAHLAGLLALFERGFAPQVWLTAREHVEVVTASWSTSASVGQVVSFFPIRGRARISGSLGLRWPLDGLSWDRGDAGISNIATAARIEVVVGEGRLLMIREW